MNEGLRFFETHLCQSKKKRLEDLLEDHVIELMIEPETIDVTKGIQRITEGRSRSVINRQNSFEGYLGQELFMGLMLQHKIPCIYANPAYENREIFRSVCGKDFDVAIPNFGFISVKTTPEGYSKKRLLANVNSWHKEAHDVVVAIKIDSLKAREASFYGWLRDSEIEDLPTKNFGTGLAYWTFLKSANVVEYNHDQVKNDEKPLLPLSPAGDLISELHDATKDTSPFKQFHSKPD